MAGYPVRSLYKSVRIAGLRAPNDTAHLKIFYPAAPIGTPKEANSGMIAAATKGAPFPVVILMPGINVGPEGLLWLAQLLCGHGVIVVTYALVGEEFAGIVSLTPGLDIDALSPQAFATRPSALALGPICDELAACHASGPLQGRIDATRIILGGHSAGGTMALLNANPDWFAGVIGCFAYGAHTGAATAFGYPPGTMHPIDPRVPVLLMGGSADGVIGQSAQRYGDALGDNFARIVATFDQAISRASGDCTLAILKGANHFSICAPKDLSSARAFLDETETLPQARHLIGSLIEAFVLERFGLPNQASLSAVLAQSRADLVIERRK